ncbi:MAG: DUF5615 family PIN-like protein [Gammaproteobacteria bacterium]|nr:DUF5615 family PIN-like protein [Gammaproteobacteria bacterium]MBA3731084.1 DUF5615 family PIN-like protein [Gammaproteobacteria bacterium]
MNDRNLKFLVDVGVGAKVEEWLRNNGFDVQAIRDIDPRMDDTAILNTAASLGRIFISFLSAVIASTRLHPPPTLMVAAIAGV